MIIKLFVFLFFLLPKVVFSQALVRDIHSSTEVLVDINGTIGFYKNLRVVILSKEEKKVTAIGTIEDTSVDGVHGVAKIKIIEVVDNFLVARGDEVELLNYELYENKKIPGFYSLTLNGNHKTPAQYKELAYYGVFTSEGHTLDKKEVLISLFQLQYGVTDDLTVKVVNALWLDGYANIGAKYTVMRNKYAKISLNAMGAYKVQAQDWIGQFGGVVSMPKNSKFQSHFMLNATFDPQYEDAKATKDLRIFKDSDIRNITEYITDRWNRVLFGPVYNVELQTFGGTISHMWIWDTFHMSLGMATRDFTNLSVGPSGYYYVYDLFWRF